MNTIDSRTHADTEQLDTPAIGDGLFFGYIQRVENPALLLEAMLSNRTLSTGLPTTFLMPLAGPDGTAIGHIEFAYHTTQGMRGRYAAVALHTRSDALPDLPIVPVLTPMEITGPTGVDVAVARAVAQLREKMRLS